MSSIENLAKVKPSENAGSRSSNRFKYQLNWGFKKLLELEYNDEDYIIILDYHDDIVICNSEKQEDYIDFYQIKTKTTADNWSYALLNNPADTSFDDEDESHAEVNERKVERTKLSILAKLLKHTQDFPESRKLYFVTNSRLAKSLYLKGGDFVEFSMLKPEVQEKIKNDVKKQIGKVEESAFEQLVFVQNQMPVNGHEKYLMGELSEFLKKKFQTIVDIPAIYETILSWLREKNDYEHEVTTKEELIEFKALTHKEFREYLEKIRVLKSFDEIKKDVLIEVKSDITFVEQHNIENCFKEISVDILNYSNVDIQKLISTIQATLTLQEPTDSDISLWKYVCRIFEVVKADYVNYAGRSDLYVKTMILYIYGRNRN